MPMPGKLPGEGLKGSLKALRNEIGARPKSAFRGKDPTKVALPRAKSGAVLVL